MFRHAPGSPRGRLLLIVALGVPAVPGCTVPLPGEAPREVTPAPPPVPVSDGNWELITSSFIGAGRIPGVPRATLAFKDGRVSAFSGCNRASATAYHADGRLEVAALTATRRGCPEPLSTFETRFFRLLRSQPVYRVDGDTLTLLGADHSAKFRRVAEGPAGASSRAP